MKHETVLAGYALKDMALSAMEDANREFRANGKSAAYESLVSDALFQAGHSPSQDKFFHNKTGYGIAIRFL